MAENELKKHSIKSNNFAQPDPSGNAPGIITPATSPAPPKTTAVLNLGKSQSGLPDDIDGLDALENYVNNMPRESVRAESAAILAELGDYGEGRSIPGGTLADYKRRDDLKTALELLKAKANNLGMTPQEIPELSDFASNQLLTISTAGLGGAALRGAYIRHRPRGRANRPCVC